MNWELQKTNYDLYGSSYIGTYYAPIRDVTIRINVSPATRLLGAEAAALLTQMTAAPDLLLAAKEAAVVLSEIRAAAMSAIGKDPSAINVGCLARLMAAINKAEGRLK